VNNDSIGDLYDGRIGTEALQRSARRRIHWMCGQARGNPVLDLGCSQGVASILLGREGREVVGVDREAKAVQAARERLALESQAVRGRVRFEIAEGGAMPFEDSTFHSVVLGEVLEHQVSPRALLRAADRVLQAGGTAVITVPYGLFRYHDHKTSIYLGPLIDLVRERWDVVEIVLIDRYLGVSLQKPGEGTPREAAVPWREALALADQRVAAHDTTVDEQARELERLRKEIEALRAEGVEQRNLSAEVEAARERTSTATRDLEELGHIERKLRSELDTMRLALASAEAERDEARRVADAVAEPR
jgi:2-polyprenyl-6-hydroxyphenyl methylase/3-demethylubiquinone-9 3-methyltransferase